MAPDIGLEWTVEWATSSPTGDEYFENLVLSREQAREYGDELAMTLRVDAVFSYARAGRSPGAGGNSNGADRS